jgi:hypothetical protein
VKQRVTFPAATGPFFDYQLQTPWGMAPPFPLLLSDVPETVGSAKKADKVPVPAGVTGVLGQPGAEDRYSFDAKKGEVWSLSLEARRLGSPLDVTLAVHGPDGKELIRNDDLPGTTDAGLEFTVPADGTYQAVINDVAGKSGTRSAIYRLLIRQPVADFKLELAAQHVSVSLGGKLDLAVKAVRSGGFKGPIAVTVKGLPAGVSAPPGLVIPADKNDLVISLQADQGAAVAAGFVTITGSATLGSAVVTRTALARTTGNLAPSHPDDNQVPAILLAATMKPRFKGHPVDQDTGRKVHRGTTFPAEVIVERLEGYQGEVVLQMAARQSYQVHGITGGDVVVPPGVGRTIYPCFMPEWLETSRTSRMGMIGVARVPDPKGNIRYVVNEMTGFITMTMEGALLKLSHENRDLAIAPGQPFEVRLKVLRLAKLAEPVRLELRLPEELTGQLKAEPMMVPVGKEDAVLRITPAVALRGEHSFTIRATALQDGKYPAISETSVSVEFLSPERGAPKGR